MPEMFAPSHEYAPGSWGSAGVKTLRLRGVTSYTRANSHSCFSASTNSLSMLDKDRNLAGPAIFRLQLHRAIIISNVI